jgi:hypothetical protein
MINFFRKLFGLCIHDWMPYELKKFKETTLFFGVNIYSDVVTKQVKTCKKCGLTKLRDLC